MKTFIAILFFAYAPLFSNAQNVVQAEYFLDADAGFGQNKLVNFTPASDGSFAFNVDLLGVPAGFHKLYIRTKDSDGKWSHTSRRDIEVLASETANKIVSGEYYFDVDPGFGAANSIPVSPQDAIILQNFTAAVSGLSIGYHKLYGRLKDTYGNWSFTFRRNVEVVKGTDNAVMLVEYFFETDNGFRNNPSITFANPLPDGSFSFNIPANQIIQGADSLFIRVKDSANANWSITAYRVGQIALPLTLLNFSATLFNEIAQLNWQTANELNTAQFTIERSLDGTNFTSVGKVKAKGNSSALTNYSYDDDVSRINSDKIYYRLSEEDRDGTISYSKVVMLSLTGSNLNFTITPNPAKDHFNIRVDRNVSGAVLLIRSVSGQTLRKQILSAGGTQTINISALTKGVYMINVITPDKTYAEKLVVE